MYQNQSATRRRLEPGRCSGHRAVMGCVLGAIALCVVIAAPVAGEIRRDPNGVNVSSQGATTVFITFGGLADQIPVEATWCGELIPATPDIGFRCDPATIFGRLPIRFDQSRLQGSVFTDIMSIPPSVARRAYQAAERGETSSFFYVRRFVSRSGGADEYVFVTCRLAGGGARVPLALLDVQVRYDDDSAVQGVARDGEAPPLRAEIAYNGTGRLRGRWEVVLPGEEPPASSDLLTEASLPPDQRTLQRRYTVLSRFDVFLPPTGRVTLPGPPPERLPTTLDGLYQILLRVEASDDKEASSSLAAAGAGDGVIHAGAVAGFPMPVLRYYVGASGVLAASGELRLLSPASGAAAGPGPIDFTWSQSSTAGVYRLEIRGADEQTLLSALLQQGIGVYRAPSWLRTKAAGATIDWRVVALDPRGERAAMTSWRELRIP